MNKNTGGPAFPHDEALNFETSTIVAASTGMSLRDYFAAQALVALFASEANPRVGRDVQPYNSSQDHRDYVAAEAYALADAMLVERAK